MTRRKGFAVRRALPSLLLLAVAGALGALAATGCAPRGGDGSPTLVTVGSRRISVADFEAFGRDPQIMAPYRQLPDSVAKRTLLEDLLSYELFAEAATRQGLDQDTAYANIERTVLPRLLPDALYDAKISSLVKTSDEEARLFHARQTKEYQLGVIRTEDSTAMRSLIARLDRGESFEEVARTGSQDPTTAGDGGRIAGWITIGQLPPDVETAVAPLAKGERTGIVPQRTGSYVFRVFDVRPKTDSPPFEEAKEQVLAALEARKRGAIVDKYLMGLKSSYGLAIDGAGWDVLRERLLPAPDSLALRMTLDPAAAGLGTGELQAPLARWKSRVYTVGDFLANVRTADPQERPPLTREDAVRMFVEGHAMNEILVAEAKQQKLENSPQVRRQLARAKAAFLVNKYLERNLSTASLGSPTPAELDSVTSALIQGMGGTGGGPVPKFADLPPVIQQQIANEWMEKKRQALLKAEVERLKAEIKPVVDEKQYARIAWPVPPPAA
jgi:hypothetical protein